MRDKFEHDEYSTKIDFEALRKCEELVGDLLVCVKFLKQYYDKLVVMLSGLFIWSMLETICSNTHIFTVS